MLAPDLFGLGDSIEAWAAAVLDQAGPEELIVVGGSVGGSVVNGVRAFHGRRDLGGFAATWDRPLIGISGDRDSAPSPSKLRHISTNP